MAISSLCALSFEELLIKFSNRTTEFVRILHALCQSDKGPFLYENELIECAEINEQLRRIRREEKELDRELAKRHGKEGVAKLNALASDIVNRSDGEPTGTDLEEAVAEMQALSMDIVSRRSA
ncbi:hypothetical protein [Maridesulfovibrio sp.]|uniref:hypothetical protein n=1 Tax=Maridesulfovibrio sp. TaxID=2795000 RepID=UPI002A1884C9|nr:hypothetical protein [Maridesulfovibrio sp.]